MRPRKTGPSFPLTVASCRTHGKHFTLYPPGYAPYRREPVIDRAPDGTEPLRAGTSSLGDFEDTLFQAALDARSGKPWARSSEDGVPERWWTTQRRHLDLSLRLVGVFGGLAEKLRETIAAVLGVDMLHLRELARKTGRGYRAKGEAVSSVLEAISFRAERGLRLLLSGHLIGHWAEPYSWDHKRCVLERLPFRAPGTAHPT